MKILVTGANGFVGSALIPRLIEEGHEVVALVRGDIELHKSKKAHDKIKWISGDLLGPKNLPKLKDIEKSFYLVHSLKEGPETFEYNEALAAVNFINWIRPTGAGIIYLGALASQDEVLSSHLRSRHLTGAILGASGLSTTEFRASIVLGDGSLSFEMIKAISERIPFRPEMTLLSHPCQPISLDDLLSYFIASLTLNEGGHTVYEIGGPDVASYGELLDLYTELAGLKRMKIKLPEVEAKVLMKALDYSIPEHSNIGRKLAESLVHPSVITDKSALKKFPKIHPKNIRVSMDIARSASKSHYAPLWEKDFLRSLLSDKLLTQSGLFSPELLRNLEKVGKLKGILSRK